jgi:very-short-patch-repair endonuclease
MADPHVKFLRQNSTAAETLLWHQLRRKRVGNLRFRRQYRLGRYVVDFVCLTGRLIIEVDGDSHDLTYENDQHRTKWLEGQGFRVIRFSNQANRWGGAVKAAAARSAGARQRPP